MNLKGETDISLNVISFNNVSLLYDKFLEKLNKEELKNGYKVHKNIFRDKF